MRKLIELFARLAGKASRLLKKGGGTSLPGKIILAMSPDYPTQKSLELSDGVVLITGTNGKTTTTRLLCSVLKTGRSENGDTILSNTAGANLLSGITTTLLGKSKKEKLGVFEVDEAALAPVAKSTKPRMLILTNLFRDQLDRYGEMESILSLWSQIIAELPPDTLVLANGDDPLVVSAVAERPGVFFFGVEDFESKVKTDNGKGFVPVSDISNCRECGGGLKYEFKTIGHLGKWHCGDCDWKRPELIGKIRNIELRGISSISLKMDIQNTTDISLALELPGLHNAYNAAAAACAAHLLGTDIDIIPTGLQTSKRAFGRFELLEFKNKKLHLELAKNPASANENLKTILLGPKPVHLLIILNDRMADGQDISWIWDIDYELLIPHTAKITASGDRAAEMGLRFLYGGMPEADIAIDPNLPKALDKALENAPQELHIMLTYTALLELRTYLSRQGAVSDFWKENKENKENKHV